MELAYGSNIPSLGVCVDEERIRPVVSQLPQLFTGTAWSTERWNA